MYTYMYLHTGVYTYNNKHIGICTLDAGQRLKIANLHSLVMFTYSICELSNMYVYMCIYYILS